MKIFSMRKKFALAAGMLTFCFGQFDAYGSDSEDSLVEKPSTKLVIEKIEDFMPGPINHIHEDIMRLIFTEASKVTDPRRLACVCKDWHNMMYLHNNMILFPTTFMEEYMELFKPLQLKIQMEDQFHNGILKYTPTNIELKFSDLE